jgi:hypothetical protein
MTDLQSQKIVTWVLEPELLEQMFKRAHNLGVGAEMVSIATDSTTGLIACVFEVSDEVYQHLSNEIGRDADFEVSENLN